MANSAADRRAQQQYANDMEAARMQREWNIEDRDEARVYSRQVLGHLVQDAQAAGFNPLTVLRNGGGASYNAAAAFAPLSRTAPTRQAPYQGHMGEAIATAGGRIADFMADFDPHADAAREQGSRFIEAQIANLEASTSGIRSNMLARETRNSGRAATLARGTGAGENGEILSIWTDWRDRDGKIVQLPNPDLPESEQFGVPVLGPTENEFAPVWRRTPYQHGRAAREWLYDWTRPWRENVR